MLNLSFGRKLAAAAGIVLCAPAWAQEQPAEAPLRGVARISLSVGNVTVTRGEELFAAEVNAPLLSQDRLTAAEGSRAEVQLDGAHVLRLAPASEIVLTSIEDRNYQLQVASGLVLFRVLRESGARVQLAACGVTARTLKKGVYRISGADRGCDLTVRSGEAEVSGPHGVATLRPVSGAPDELETWSAARDRELLGSNSLRYLSSDIYGAEELDAHGRWMYDPSYGNVWVPTVSADWAPYRVGRWARLDYYDWTWISADPFGWAPYHYGNWYRASFGWAWYPGRISARHHWRPALVAFFGFGSPASGVGLAFGNVGWVPLAPREIFRPWYGRNAVTIVDRGSVVQVYRNARVANGLTAIHAGRFGHGPIHNGQFLRPSARELEHVGSLHGPLPMRPHRGAPGTLVTQTVVKTTTTVKRSPAAPRSRSVTISKSAGQGRRIR